MIPDVLMILICSFVVLASVVGVLIAFLKDTPQRVAIARCVMCGGTPALESDECANLYDATPWRYRVACECGQATLSHASPMKAVEVWNGVNGEDH